VPGYALDPDAIKSYIKIGQLQEIKKKWPAGKAAEGRPFTWTVGS